MHGRYRRRLVDAAIAGARVVIDLLVRRFRCAVTNYPTVTVAEQVEGLTSPHARFTPLARRMLEAVGLALAGRGRGAAGRAAGSGGGARHPLAPGACAAGTGHDGRAAARCRLRAAPWPRVRHGPGRCGQPPARRNASACDVFGQRTQPSSTLRWWLALALAW
ncbi:MULTISPECIES: hypothetical protein [unclassified Pseudofrankia]|uniref:hypothetical protein n=1 Tax=unclassified Pseudofrankia TaxID=2994372 RepID=UPI001F51A3E1|nr:MULTISPECIES: hypothetical protein [unclassified Pseudofrankia]MDT3446862.1 hypothetical protein [Pseudofrankia sp. BMG5.37]